jgi:hypothetical protein
VILILAGAGVLLSLALATAQHVRPRRVATDTAAGSVIRVAAGGDLQAALERARPGDTVMLAAGATYRGAFRLPKKAGASFVTVRTSASDAQLPAAGERLDPRRHAALLPKLVGGVSGEPVVRAEPGTHHYRFVGIEFGPTVGGENDIVQLGTGREATAEELPHDFEFERCYFRGDARTGQRRGIALNARAVAVRDSHFADFKREGDESQAMAGWGGPGPFEITNNYIEAAGEGVLFGGAAPAMQVTPADIVVRGNHFNKPTAWRSGRWVVKNHLELKNARRVLIEGNLLTNVWTSGQEGTAVLFTVRAEDGRAPWAAIEDVEFKGNVVRGAGNCFLVHAYEGRGGRRLVIRDNLFADIDKARWGGDGKFLVVSQWDGLTVEQNTIITSGAITSAYGRPTTGFVFRRNIVTHNEYGFHGDGREPGAASLGAFFPGAQVSDNAIVGGRPQDYSARNAYPATLDAVGFVDWRAGDFRLRPDSPLLRGGAHVGAHVEALPQSYLSTR